MKSNLDVWAIQKDKEETRIALENVKKDSLGNILYLNCYCKFSIGDKEVESRLFDACFYSEESDTVILFAKGRMKREEIEDYLKEYDIQYTVIKFAGENDSYKFDKKIPDIWFVREEYVLIDAIDDSLSKDVTSCTFYGDLESELSLSYLAGDDNNYEIEGRFFKGVLVFDDKIVLFVNQGDERNMDKKSIEKVLKEKGVDCKVISKSSKR